MELDQSAEGIQDLVDRVWVSKEVHQLRDKEFEYLLLDDWVSRSQLSQQVECIRPNVGFVLTEKRFQIEAIFFAVDHRETEQIAKS